MPLDLSEVRRIVDENIRALRWIFQLQEWHISITDEAIDGNAKGERIPARVTTDSRYRTVRLQIDPSAMDSREELLWSVIHELAHVMHAELNLYRQALSKTVDDTVFSVLEEIYIQACERIAWQIESMIRFGFKFNLEDLLRIGQKNSDVDPRSRKSNSKRKRKRASSRG